MYSDFNSRVKFTLLRAHGVTQWKEATAVNSCFYQAGMWLCLLRHTNTPQQEYAFTVCVVSQYRGGREEWPSWNIVCVCVCPCKKKTPSENVRLHLRRFAFLSACICMCVVLRDLEVIWNCSTVEEQRQQWGHRTHLGCHCQ